MLDKAVSDWSAPVEDGRPKLDKLGKSILCPSQLLGKLRKEGTANLGSVRRAYPKANGNFSVITFEDEAPQPGLPSLSPIDTAFREE